MIRILAVIAAIVFIFSTSLVVRADEYDDITSKLSDLRRSLESSQRATQTNQKSLDKLNTQLEGIKAQVAELEEEIARKEKEVASGEKALEKQKDTLDTRAVSYYKNLGKNSMTLLEVLVSNNLSYSLQNFFYQKSLIDEDRKAIIKIASYIKDLEDKKVSMESDHQKLSAIKEEVDKQSQFLANEVAKSKKYEESLQSQIAQLTARQQQIIAQKQASLNLPTSAGSSAGKCSDDRNIDPGFSPRFAFFTFGVPNRVGLNQYGAKGRAESGQNAEQILKAYYNADYTTGYNQSVNIHVQGSNEYGQSFDDNWSVEDYLKHLYEMPTNWPAEALKAQAIAARSFALAYTNNGSGSICPSQQCQVVKREENNDAWKQAVQQTAGIVLTNGGQPIKAWFSSTHGGYVFSSGDVGWSSTNWTKNAVDSPQSINSFTDLQNNAYDRSSPWFYCDWGSRPDYNKTAWLKPEEVADITNALMLAKRDGSTAPHLSQTDKSNPDGVDTWDANKVKSELKDRGGSPYNSVSSISIDWDKGSGRATTVHISGDAGDQSFNATEFKSYFNVRAPANVQIVGPLFNVEKR